MFAYGRGDVLFSYILPHGLLELTSVFVAAAAGLRIFWSWIAPGARTRGAGARRRRPRAVHRRDRLRHQRCFVSGVIEGFVTPSALPVWAKIAIGALALGAFLAYMLVARPAGRPRGRDRRPRRVRGGVAARRRRLTLRQ